MSDSLANPYFDSQTSKYIQGSFDQSTWLDELSANDRESKRTFQNGFIEGLSGLRKKIRKLLEHPFSKNQIKSKNTSIERMRGNPSCFIDPEAQIEFANQYSQSVIDKNEKEISEKNFERSVFLESVQLVQEVGQYLLELQKNPPTIHIKEARSLVGDSPDGAQLKERGSYANADVDAHLIISKRLALLFPNANIITEEGIVTAVMESGYSVVIDPLDGTIFWRNGNDSDTQSTGGKLGWSINICLFKDGKLINGIVHIPTTGNSISFDGESVMFRDNDNNNRKTPDGINSNTIFVNGRVPELIQQNYKQLGYNIVPERTMEGSATDVWQLLWQGNIHGAIVTDKNLWDFEALMIVSKDPRFTIEKSNIDDKTTYIITRTDQSLINSNPRIDQSYELRQPNL